MYKNDVVSYLQSVFMILMWMSPDEWPLYLFYEASSDVCELTMYMVWYQEEQCLKHINRLATLFVCLRNQMLLGLLHWKYCSDFFISLCLFWISLSFTLFTRISSSFYSFCGRLLYLKLLKIGVQNAIFFSSQTWFYLCIFIFPTHNQELFLFYYLQSRQCCCCC